MKEDFEPDYWKQLWAWYNDGGDRHVAAYLASLDISAFDPKAPPPKTEAFWAIVDAHRAPEDAELADVIDEMNNPDATTIALIVARAKQGDFDNELQNWLTDRRNRRAIPHRLEKCDYVPVRNTDAKDGFWKVDGKRQVIYAKRTLTVSKQIAAAKDLVVKAADRPDGDGTAGSGRGGGHYSH